MINANMLPWQQHGYYIKTILGNIIGFLRLNHVKQVASLAKILNIPAVFYSLHILYLKTSSLTISRLTYHTFTDTAE